MCCATLLAALVAAGCGGSDNRVALRNGPVDAGDDSEASAYIEVGKPIAWGFATLSNTSEEDVILESVEVVGVPRQLEVLDVKVSPPERPRSIGFGRWPVTEVPVRAVRGTRLPPSSEPGADLGVEVIVGVRSKAEGRWATKALRVTYEVGGERYTEEFRQSVEICTEGEKCAPG